jgi:hypothetical protein
MKNTKNLWGILVVLVLVPFSSNAMHADFIEAPHEGDMTETGPKKERPKDGGWLDKLNNFLRGKSGGSSTTGNKPTTGKTQTTGGKTTTSSQSSTVAGESDGNSGMTAQDAQAERAVGKDAVSFGRKSSNVPVKTEMTLEQKEKIVDAHTDLSIMEKAIVKSVLGGARDVEQVISALKSIEGEIIDQMGGRDKSFVPSDRDKNDTAEFVKKLKLLEEGCLYRLRNHKESDTASDLDEAKLRLLRSLLDFQSRPAVNKFFEDDMEPQISARKSALRSKKR